MTLNEHAEAILRDIKPVTLNDCPPGLFVFGGTLCFKSEYATTLENPPYYQCDAYCVESGEYFWGGAKGTEARGKLMVQPLDQAAILAALQALHTESFDAGALAMRGKAEQVAEGRAEHAKELMLSDDKGVTDARVAFQLASELVAKDIAAIDPATLEGRNA